MNLKKYYNDPQFPGAFSGVNTFFRALKEINPQITRKEVNKFLKSSDSYTLHKPVRKVKIFRRVYAKGIKYLFQIDLVDMRKYSSDNDEYNYIIMIIDVFSKYGWAFTTKRKDGESMVKTLKTFLFTQRPSKLQFDAGSEFYNSKFLHILKTFGIKYYSTTTEIKA